MTPPMAFRVRLPPRLGVGIIGAICPTQLNQFSTPVEVAEVANLMYDCGVAADMNYGFGASGATDYHASHGMHNFFGYEDPYIYLKEDFSTSEWLTKLKTNLNAGYPDFLCRRRQWRSCLGCGWVRR
jgi:hypothetical protein